MRILFVATFACIFGAVFAQQPDQYAADAFVVMRMVQKYHVQPREMNETFSRQFFDHFLHEADDEHFIFTAEDLQLLTPYRNRLADEVRSRQTAFLRLATSIYEKRIRSIDSLLLIIKQQPIDLLSPENFTAQEDTLNPANTIAQKQKLARMIRKDMIGYILDHSELTSRLPLTRLKKIADSLEPEARAKTIGSFQRGIRRLVQGANGIGASLGVLYCESLAQTFDPHSSYMPKSDKENFEAELGQRSMRFGFSLEEENTGVSIRDLKPGSAAFKSGQINKGDKIMSVQWDNKQPIDVSESGIAELMAILDQSNYGILTLTLKKADGLLRKVEMQKELMENDDEDDRVKGFMLKAEGYNMGYISLPAFYTDWDNLQNNVKGCANDIAKEIIRLKKEGMNGLVLDLRYNGGGSIQEAIELTGIFIDAGPVAQVNTVGGKTYSLKDINRGTIYDGPLMLLVNGASASASELVAGTLQDYHRAVIMGTSTYGKATGQVIMALDSLAKPDAAGRSSNASAFIKLTVEKLYRVTGATAQGSGVQPDIILADLAEAVIKHESDEPTALQASRIDANKFYTPLAGDSLSAFVYRGRAIADTSTWYSMMKKNAQLMKNMEKAKDISLQLQDVVKLKEKSDAWEKQVGETAYDSGNFFSIQDLSAEDPRLKAFPALKAASEEWKQRLKHDAWIVTAFRVLQIKNK